MEAQVKRAGYKSRGHAEGSKHRTNEQGIKVAGPKREASPRHYTRAKAEANETGARGGAAGGGAEGAAEQEAKEEGEGGGGADG